MAVAFAERAGESAMTDDVPTEDATWERMLRAWQELDIPEGWRAEVHGKDIVVAPPPSGSHGLIVADIQTPLAKIAPEGVVALQNIGVQIPAVARLYVPDLILAPRDAIPLDATPAASSDLLLVAEITSRANADDDREEKRRAYANGEVPLYLLIDPWDRAGPTVTLFADSRGSDYDSVHRVPFGKTVAIPDPFGVELETKDLPLHPRVQTGEKG